MEVLVRYLILAIACSMLGCTTVRVQKGGPSYQVCNVYHLENLIDMTKKTSKMVFVCKEVDEKDARETLR